jgi:hypothetical protein
MHTGSLCRPCTTRGISSHAGLSPGASSSPVGMVSHQLNCTMRSSTGGCGFRAICLTTVDFGGWAARFCRTIPGTCSHVNTSLTLDRAGVCQPSRAGVCQPYASLRVQRVAQCPRRRGMYRMHSSFVQQLVLSPRCNSCKVRASDGIMTTMKQNTTRTHVALLLIRNAHEQDGDRGGRENASGSHRVESVVTTFFYFRLELEREGATQHTTGECAVFRFRALRRAARRRAKASNAATRERRCDARRELLPSLAFAMHIPFQPP